MIHSANPTIADGIIVFAHVVRSYVTFQNLAKQNKVITMFTTGETVGLVEWIIDDTCPVYIFTLVGLDHLQEKKKSFF